MKISIHLVNVHQNRMNLNENLVKHLYHVMNMIWEVVALMVNKILSLLIILIICSSVLDEWSYNHLLKYRNVHHNII
jgi:hypothetical protein